MTMTMISTAIVERDASCGGTPRNFGATHSTGWGEIEPIYVPETERS